MKKLLLFIFILLISTSAYSQDSKLTALSDITSPVATDDLYIVDDPGGTPISRKIDISALMAVATDLDAGGALSTDSVSDNEIDYTTVTLADLTFDVGSVSTTEFGYLNNVTSAIQTQLNAKEGTLTNEAGLYSALSDVTNFLQTGDTLDDDDVAFDDADSNFTATTIGAAIEELDNDSGGSAPNQSDYKINWNQIGNMPAGFSDGTDADSGGAPEGTAVLSTGEGGGTKYLREDGDNTCSWQAVTASLSADSVDDTHIDWGTGANQVSLLDIPVDNENGTPTVDTAGEYLTYTGSSGYYSGGVVSANGTGVDVTAIEGIIRASSSTTADIINFTVSAATALAITDDSVEYIYIDYNSGTPQFVANSSYTVEAPDMVLVGGAVDEGGTVVSVWNEGVRLDESIAQAGKFLRRVHTLIRDERVGGLAFSDTGTNDLTMTAGNLWRGRTEYTITSKDTSDTDTFTTYSRDGVGGFDRTTSVGLWDNAYWDDGTGTLNTISSNNFGTHWLFVTPDDDAIHLVYGRADHNTEAAAETEAIPSSLPDVLTANGVLAARLIFAEADTSSTSISSSFTSAFGGTSAPTTADISDVSVEQTEFAELEAIGATVISAADWIALSNLSGTNSGDSHTIASHSDTTATGAETETLTDGSNSDSLHVHASAGLSGIVNADLSGTAGITNANLALTAGRSLTESTNDISADAETYIYKAKIAFEDPVAGDDFFFDELQEGVTFTSIYAKTLVGTVDFDITIAGSDINGSDIQATTSGVLDSSLGGDTAGALGEEVKLEITSVASSPTFIMIVVTGTYDD